MNTPPSISLDDLTISYNRIPAVHHVSGEFKSGSLTAITGPNGGGKSTLLKAIAGVIPAREGAISVSGEQPRIAYLPQASEIVRDFPLSALHVVCMGFWHQTRGFGKISRNHKQTASVALDQVGLGGFENRDVNVLSTGQWQRLMFARLIVQDAPLILLDEPFAGVDEATTGQLLSKLIEWHLEGRTILCVLHDYNQILEHFPECLVLAREAVSWGATPRQPIPATVPLNIHGIAS